MRIPVWPVARKVDFLSVGSNDLTQYLLAVDRNNARVADLYHSFHPAVLQALRQVAGAARDAGKPVSICGELAGDPGASLLLLAMGYDVLSMNATNLTKVKKALRSIDSKEAEVLLEQVMGLEDSGAVHARLEEFLVEKGLSSFIHARLGTGD